MSLLEKLEARRAQERAEDVAWRKDVEKGIEWRFGRQIGFLFLIALMSASIALVGKFVLTGTW